MEIRAINSRLEQYHVRLIRGDGYFYYTYDDGTKFDTRSVYTQRLSDLPDEEWISDGITFAKEMQGGPDTCTEGLDAQLTKALMEGYRAIIEAKVNQVMTPLYNYLIGSGDWSKVESGEHDVAIKIGISLAIANYLKTHYRPGEIPLGVVLGKLTISTTRNSDSHAYKNMIRDVRNAYRLACIAEYELAGHDLSKMVWPGKAQRFMDNFCRGRTAWSPGDKYGKTDSVISVEPMEQAKPATEKPVEAPILNGQQVDTTGWDDWKKYQANKPIKRHTH